MALRFPITISTKYFSIKRSIIKIHRLEKIIKQCNTDLEFLNSHLENEKKNMNCDYYLYNKMSDAIQKIDIQLIEERINNVIKTQEKNIKPEQEKQLYILSNMLKYDCLFSF